ncbi:O-antigen ligase domain-containing protein [Knoellia aerolata]|uniref:O-antigen ligase domain-containing protein n=1 Tax=Knoellia aerolata TaxID=442954 RepID=UPI000ACD0D8A|nr:O-antigen ligase domain-containing protein [Knoellia aerolata]
MSTPTLREQRPLTVGRRHRLGRHARRETHFAPVPRLVLLSWAALLFNVLTPGGAETIIPLPGPVAQVMAQGALLVALVLALLANPRLVLRPHAVLVLLSVLALMSLVVSLHSEFIVGAVYRSLRLLGFVTVLWLLSPWWGRRDLVLLRAHRLCLGVVLASVLVGAALAPGKAFAVDGRLGGTVWPVPPTQVAHYAAVIFGTTVILWMCRVVTGPHALAVGTVSTVALIGTHTRTALLGALLGLAVASASLFLGHARVRRVSVSTLLGIVVGTLVFAPQVITWLARGQSSGEASRLTGRTDVWADVFATPRPLWEQFLGTGLSNKSFDGLPIDSNWVATYVDQGWVGMMLEASILVVLLLAAATHVRGPRRALALFLVVYCIVASVTETGLGDASPYLLDLAVAASLLASAPGRSPTTGPGA